MGQMQKRCNNTHTTLIYSTPLLLFLIPFYKIIPKSLGGYGIFSYLCPSEIHRVVCSKDGERRPTYHRAFFMLLLSETCQRSHYTNSGGHPVEFSSSDKALCVSRQGRLPLSLSYRGRRPSPQGRVIYSEHPQGCTSESLARLLLHGGDAFMQR